MSAVNPDRQFLGLVTSGYVVIAVMEYLQMGSKDERPASFREGMNRSAFFDKVAYAVVDTYILKFKSPLDILQPMQEVPQPLVEHGYYKSPAACGYHACPRTFTSHAIWLNHRRKCKYKVLGEARVSTKKATAEDLHEDHKYNYVCHLLQRGILDMCRHDATREGDGMRLYVLWKNDLLLLKKANHTNYSILAFMFVAQYEALLNERERHQLIHNRCVNVNGGRGNNVPGDLAMEFLNKEVKPHLQHKIGNLTSKVFERTGKSIKVCKDVVRRMDQQIELYTSVGSHSENYYLKEVGQMVNDLVKENLFKCIPDRFFPSFPNFVRFPEYDVDGGSLRQWLAEQKLKIHNNQHNSERIRAAEG